MWTLLYYRLLILINTLVFILMLRNTAYPLIKKATKGGSSRQYFLREQVKCIPDTAVSGSPQEEGLSEICSVVLTFPLLSINPCSRASSYIRGTRCVVGRPSFPMIRLPKPNKNINIPSPVVANAGNKMTAVPLQNENVKTVFRNYSKQNGPYFSAQTNWQEQDYGTINSLDEMQGPFCLDVKLKTILIFPFYSICRCWYTQQQYDTRRTVSKHKKNDTKYQTIVPGSDGM